MKRKTGMKRSVCRIISFMMIFSLLSVYGCKEKKIEVVDYPEPTVTEVTDNTQDAANQDEDTNSAMPSALDLEALKPEVNTLKEEGTFVYNAAVIPDWILKEFENNPKIVRIAKEILVAIDHAEEEYEFSSDLNLTEDELIQVTLIISYSCPFYSQIIYEKAENENVYTLKYFPNMEASDAEVSDADIIDTSAYGNKGYNMSEFASQEEAIEIMDSYKDYVTALINDNLNSEMSEREMAAVIYSELVRGASFSPENPDYYLGQGEESIDPESYFGRKAVDNIIEQKYTRGIEILRTYQYIMNQLHIESRLVVGNGIFQDEVKEQFGEKYPTTPYWSWLSMQLDGEYFNCDIILEKLIHDFKFGDDTDVYPEMTYFGMSDDKRKESYKFMDTSIYLMDITDLNAEPPRPPKCPSNYEYHYFD